MNVVFDIGQVLLHWEPRALYRKIFADESEMEAFLRDVCPPAWNVELDRGQSFAEGVAEATQRHPHHAEKIAAYDTRWAEMLTHAIQGSVDILEELHQRGTPLYAITNWNGDKFRQTRELHAFLGRFRDIVLSGDEKLIKPDAAIYHVLLARNSLAAADCLFIDDSAKNVAGAQAVGMQAHHFTTPDALRQELARRGLL